MLSVANYLKKPRRGEPPPSDVEPGSPAVVGSGIVQCLRVKGFCVINNAVSEQMLQTASAELGSQEWYQPAVLIQEGLLGVEGSNRICRMASIDFPDQATDQFQDGLAGIDFAMWKLAEAVGPFQDELGFRCCGRSIGFLHQASDPDLEEAELTDQEASDWSAIFTSRKIMILVFLGPGKGTLEMQPYDDEANVSEITTVPGLVVVLRTDQLSFKFFCRGREATHVASSFMLQNDVLRMHRNKLEAHLTPAAQELDQWIDQRLREIKEMEDEPTEDWKTEVPRSFIHAANRTWFKRQTTVVRGAAARLPVTWEPEVFFLGLTSGADTVIEVPIMRWEHDTVYDPSPDCWKKDPPKTNCRHASFIDGVDLFDNKLFGLSLAETKGMDPGQRLVLEVTYDSLYRSGMKKSNLINSTVGMYVGTSQSEWNQAEKAADVGIFGATGGAPSITAGRLSFCLGCKGASLAIDTEAASGLSAVFWAAESVEKKGAGHIQEAACGIGVHLCLAKAWWPAHTTAGFLCPGGRCFTFDSSAQGHVRSEGVGTMVLKCQEKMEAMEVKDDQLNVGTLVGGATQNSGKSAGMSAPNGPAEQAVLIEACRKSGIMALDVDVVECHGSGRFIADAVEAASCGRALRDGADADQDAEMLQLCSMKSNIGNCIETSGIASLIKTLHSIRWGIVCANNHLNQLNPHLDLSSCPLLMCTEPTEQKLSAVFMGVSAWGFGGTNVHMHCYGGVDEEIRLPPEPTPQELRPRLSYWPSGGGDLGSMSRPRRGFFIIGSWSSWTEPEAMEDEGDGCYGYTLVLGDERWEQFQLLIDNNYAKVLHPRRFKAPKGTEVYGPTRTEEVMQESTWLVDGRPFTAQIRPIADSQGSSALAERPSPMEYKNEDEGMPGQRYRIRLHIAGKWRTVTWAKLEGSGSGPAALKG